MAQFPWREHSPAQGSGHLIDKGKKGGGGRMYLQLPERETEPRKQRATGQASLQAGENAILLREKVGVQEIEAGGRIALSQKVSRRRVRVTLLLKEETCRNFRGNSCDGQVKTPSPSFSERNRGLGKLTQGRLGKKTLGNHTPPRGFPRCIEKLKKTQKKIFLLTKGEPSQRVKGLSLVGKQGGKKESERESLPLDGGEGSTGRPSLCLWGGKKISHRSKSKGEETCNFINGELLLFSEGKGGTAKEKTSGFSMKANRFRKSSWGEGSSKFFHLLQDKKLDYTRGGATCPRGTQIQEKNRSLLEREDDPSLIGGCLPL